MSPSKNNKASRFASFLAVAGVAGLAIMSAPFAPAADAAISLSAASDSPGGIILGGLTSMVPKPVSLLDKYLVPGLLNLTSVGLAITKPTQIVVSVNGSLLNPMGAFPLNLGNVGLNVFLDDMSLANITTSPLSLAGGIGPLNVSVAIDVPLGGANPAIQTSINNLVSGFFGGVTPSGVPPKLVVSGLTLNGNPLGMAPITIPTQFKPLGLIMPTNVTTPTDKPPVIGFGGMMNPLINFTMPTLEKVTVKAVTGAQLTAGVAFSWNNPLNVNLDIPSVSLDLGLNGTRVFTVNVEAIHLAPGPMTAETYVHLQFNNDPVAAAQLGALVNDFLAGTINQVVNIGNFTFGGPDNTTTPATIIMNNLFGGLALNLPLMNVSTVAIQQMVTGLIQPYLPIDISNLGAGTGPSIMTYIQSLAVSTAPGHTLLIQPKINLPLPFALDLSIPYLALDVNLDGNVLGQLFLADLVGSGSGNVAVSVGIGMIFRVPDPAIPPTVAKIVTGLTTGSSVDVTAGISNFAIGVSPSDAVNTLNYLNFAVPISSVVTGHIDVDSLIQKVIAMTSVTIAPNAISLKIGSLAEMTIHEAAIAVLPNNLVTASINLDMFMGLPIIANIGYFGLQLSLDGSNLAGIALNSGLSYAGGKVQMQANTAISVGTGPEIAGKVADLVNAVIAHQAVHSSVGVAGIVIGHSSDDIIDALSQVSVSMPLGGLIGAGATMPPGLLDGILAKLGLAVTDLSLATIPNAGLQVGARAAFSNPIPISLSIPFIGVSGGLDKIDIVDVGLNDLGMTPGANSLQAKVNLNFNNADNAQSKVATFVGEVLGGQLGNTPEAITIHNLRIGASPSDYFDILSQIDISIPSKDILNKPNLDAITAKLGLNLGQLTGNLMNNLKIGAISANLNKAPVIDLGTSISISNFSLNAAVDIGYFGIDLALDTHSLAHVDVPSITISTANNQLTLAIKASITVQDTSAIQTDIANIFNYFMTNSTTAPVNALVISKPLLGVSTSDNIKTFSLIQFPIALPELLAKARVTIAQLLAGAGGLNMNNIAISGLVLDLNNPSVISVQGGLQVKNFTLPADISISYVGVSLGLDAVPLADLTVPSLVLSSANNQLSVTFQANLNLNQGQDASSQVAPPTNLVIYNPVFGGDPQHLFHILSQVKVPVALAPYLQKIGAILNGAGGSNLLAGLDIGALKVNLNTPQTIGIDAAIAIKNVTIPAEIKLNYVGCNLAINTIGLAQVSVPQFTLKPVEGALTISAHIEISMLTSKELTGAISNLIGAIMNNVTTPATNLVVSGAVFGGSPTNVFTILQGIALPIDIAPIINKLPALIASQGSLLNRVAISDLVLDLNSPQTIALDAGILVKNVSLPAQIELNYVGADIAINAVPLARVSVPQFTLAPSGADLALKVHVNVDLVSSPGLTQTIGGLVGAILGNQTLPDTKLILSGAVFGASSTNYFTFLQGVVIPIDVTSIINKLPAMIGGQGSLLDRNVSLPAQIKLNYVGANVGINTIPLAKVAIPQFSLAPSGADLAVKAKINLDLISSPELSQAISGLIGGILNNQTLPKTNLVLSGAVFGGSPTNVFTILQGLAIPIDISPYIAKIGGMLGGAGSLLNGIGLSGLAIDLNQAPNIGVDANIAIQNLALPAQLSVGYVGLSVAVNSVPLVKIGIPKIQLGTSGTALTIATHVDATLQESENAQALVAGLVNAIIAGQVPQGTVTISNIGFGPSESNVYNILKGVQIPIPISKIISLVPAGGAGNATSILDRISLESADINMKNPPSIGADVAVALLGFQFDAKLLLNYVSVSAFLDSTPLATVSVPGISLTSGTNQVALKANALVNLASNDEIQTKVAAIADEVMGKGTPQNVNLVVSNIAFGGSASKTFHILDKIKVSVPLAPYIKQLTGIIGGGNATLPGGGAPSFSITQLDISAPGPKDLSIAIGASIGGIGSKISVDMPYIGAKVSAVGIGLVNPVINNLSLKNGNVGLTLALPFQPAASSIMGLMSTPISQLLFTQVGKIPGELVINSIAFGASASQAYDIAGKVRLGFQMDAAFQAAQAYINAHNPLHVNDMNTVLTTAGIQATIVVPGIPLGGVPLKMNFPISLQGMYKRSPFLAIQATSMNLGGSPWSFGANIQVIQPAFGTAMQGILPNALTWKNALQDVTLGGITLGQFTVLSGLAITPPEVTLWSPINMPLDALKLHLTPLGLDFAVAFVNKGPLQVDMGSIDVSVMTKDVQVIEVTNLGGPIHLNNGLQSGGNNRLSMNASLKFTFLEFFTIIASLFTPSNFYFKFRMLTSSGQPMPWLEDALNGVPAVIFQNLLPILANALKNVKFTL
ncbi:hypothetical protein BGZ96_004257 [Linnemannia gamsii]|uniref:Uncharacterized protein n=1 Tax=Linnemannia gamsii TaxID=64522 RepID=A0ABQ7KF34_9FUNG|nr:hypothetical protein BGZ96_004257 [Linnemannia gamsii]